MCILHTLWSQITHQQPVQAGICVYWQSVTGKKKFYNIAPRISSDKIQNNFCRLSTNLTDKLSSHVINRFSSSGGGGGAGSVSSSSRMSTGSTDVSSTTSNVEMQNSILQTVAMKAIPCVDIQVRQDRS